LRMPLRDYLVQDTKYEEAFDRFEYLLALVHADLNLKQQNRVWGPIGRFGWRNRNHFKGGIMKQFELEATDAGKNWAPLKVGLFDGSVERFQSVKTAFDELVGKVNWW
jgi:hypothetical protein